MHIKHSSLYFLSCTTVWLLLYDLMPKQDELYLIKSYVLKDKIGTGLKVSITAFSAKFTASGH